MKPSGFLPIPFFTLTIGGTDETNVIPKDILLVLQNEQGVGVNCYL